MTGRIYDGRRQHQGRRPPRTPAQARKLGIIAVAIMVGLSCFCGGILVAAWLWLVGLVQR